ncbi:histidine kinase [Mycolicibacter heraklionensis]|uniref:histidine kinase n=1 Tax=Mycolicibacter heraklionensis TaxID=512402 RepID=A0ABR5FBX8_9MYCO|nr:histidine kinase [Mycolicibacter heraklionensis]KLO26764.1 histidine kinase [Mycolicibacter heraklionensis]
MLRVVTTFVRDQLRHRSTLIPPGYSWLFVLLIDGAMLAGLAAALLQRPGADLPVGIGAAVVASAPLLLFFLAGIKFLPGLVLATSAAATAVLLFATSTPVPGDLAPVLLVVALGAFAALSPLLSGAVALGLVSALLMAAAGAHRLESPTLYLGMAAMGWLVGILTRIQAGLLVHQQELQADLARAAAADERRRIAREVHDVIAHSLSITLLHVTGARRALQQDRDVDDAVEALTDAERLGRQAMADIRRTVGLLDDGRTGNAPEPGVADIPTLVVDYRQAGVDAELRSDGRIETVSAAVGLALYRIAQESLANVAKHAPDSKALVDLAVSPSTVVLSVVNRTPAALVWPPADGHGITGMRQRVELLGGTIDIGPGPQGWSVRAEIPLTDPGPQRRRCGHDRP